MAVLTLAVTAGAGSTVPTVGSHEYADGSVVSGITAFPNPGYVFTRWLLDGVQYTSNPITVVMDTDHTLNAEFSGEPPPPPTTYNLNITATEGGVTAPQVGLSVYDADNVILVTAFPGEGYRFDSWLLDGAARTENPITVTMNEDHSLHAIFVEEAAPPPQLENLGVPVACGLGAVSLIAGVVGYSYLRGRST